MNSIEQLKTILETDVLLQVKEDIEELEQQLQKKQNKELKEELLYIKQVKLYFDEVLEDIELGNMTPQDAQDILDNLEDMKIENEDEV